MRAMAAVLPVKTLIGIDGELLVTITHYEDFLIFAVFCGSNESTRRSRPRGISSEIL